MAQTMGQTPSMAYSLATDHGEGAWANTAVTETSAERRGATYGRTGDLGRPLIGMYVINYEVLQCKIVDSCGAQNTSSDSSCGHVNKSASCPLHDTSLS